MNTTRRVQVATTVAAVLALVAAGCGDDENGTASTGAPAPATEPAPVETDPPATEPPATEPPATEPPATEPPATEPASTEPPATEPPDEGAEPDDPAAVCEAYVDVTLGFSGEPDEAAVEAIGVGLDAIDANLPDEVADELSTMTAAARDVLASGGEDFSSFETPEFLAATNTVDPWMFENCAFENKTEVTGEEYAFVGFSQQMPAGRNAILFGNGGNEVHEMAIMRKAAGVTSSWDEILELPEEEARTMVEQVAGTFAPGTGDVGLAVADFTPGEYIVLCFVPTGTVFEGGEFVEGEGPPHFVQGMRTEFTVS